MNRYLVYVSIISFFSFASLQLAAQQQVTNGSNTQIINFPGTCTYNWTVDNPSIGLSASGAGTSIPSFVAINSSNIPVTAKITATPSHTGFAYIPNNASATISVIDISDYSLVKNISTDLNPFGVAASIDGTRVYVTNSGSNTVSVIRTSDNTILKKIQLNTEFPSGIAVNADGSKIYVANAGSGNVSVINTTTYAIDAPIAVGDNPQGIVVSPDGSKVYVANYSSNTVSVINTATRQVVNIPVDAGPHGLVTTLDGSKLYVTNELADKVTIINTADNTIRKVLSTIQGPYAITIKPDGTQIYLTTGIIGGLQTIDNQTEKIVSTINLGSKPFGASVNAINGLIYIADVNYNVVQVYDPVINLIVKVVDVQSAPYAFGNYISYGVPCNANGPLTYTITVNPSAVTSQINISAVSGSISSCEGTASSSPEIEQFTVSGVSLTDDIEMLAPDGFEVSTDAGNGYGSHISIAAAGGSVTGKTIYIRSSVSAAAGLISGQIKISSGGLQKNVAVSASILPLPIVNQVANQIKQNGELTDAVNFIGSTGSYAWVNDNPAIGLAANGTGDISPFNVINKGIIPVVANITVTPQPANYVYVAGSTSSVMGAVSIINTNTNAVVKVITDGMPAQSYPISILVSPDKTRVYVADQGSHTITIINTATNEILATIPAGFYPTALAISPDGKKIYAADFDYGVLSVINTDTYDIILTLNTLSNPYDIEMSADGAKLYVANTGDETIQVFDTALQAFVKTITVGTSPNDITISPDNKLLYVTNYNSNNVSVVDIATQIVVKTIPTEPRPYKSIISRDGKQLYVVIPEQNSVIVYNTANNAKITAIQVGQHPADIKMNTDGSLIYLNNGGATNSVSVISTAENKVINTITVDQGSLCLAILSNDNGCGGVPMQFSITAQPSAVIPPVPSTDIIVPNTFTPNGDGKNDSWEIKGLENFPNNTVEVYNRYGERLYSSIGYNISWDGKFKGNLLPSSTYYYIINPKNGRKVISGNVTIIR